MSEPDYPKRVVDETIMFGGNGYDMATSQRMIEERWKLFYPSVPYSPLVKAVTAVGVATEVLSGENQTTAFDPLWGESVDRPAGQTQWRQPHASAVTSQDAILDPARVAAEPEIRAEERRVHMRIHRISREDLLKKLGFDLVRTLVGCVPTTMFDRIGITPQPGDRFRWNDEWYEVLQTSPQGWYKNTTHNLFWYLSVKSARIGS
jgi:hypothetical protein